MGLNNFLLKSSDKSADSSSENLQTEDRASAEREESFFQKIAQIQQEQISILYLHY